MNFDYLRLALASTVMLWHLGIFSLPQPQLWNTEIAVLAFFCISGFLITLSFEREPDLTVYLRKRMARIYPPIVVCVLALIAVGMLTHQQQGFFRGVFSLLLFQDWQPLAASGVYGHGAFWTLVIEFQFYLLLPIALWAWKRWPLRTVVVLIAIAFASFQSRRLISGGVEVLAYRENIFTVAHFFIAGMLTALYAPRIAERRYFWALILPIAISAYLFQQLRGNEILPYAMPAAMMAIILAVARATIFFGKQATWGDISYGVYIYHFPVLFAIGHVADRFSSLLMERMVVAVATVAMAFISWHFFERPAIDLAKGRLTLNTFKGEDAGCDVART